MLVDFTLSNAKLKATGWKPKHKQRFAIGEQLLIHLVSDFAGVSPSTVNMTRDQTSATITE
jgi:hypothetical protein